MELFDLYDENNDPLNITASGEDVHKTLAHYHRTSVIWIINNRKNILCQKR